MADNLGITPGTGAKVATDELTYGGETAHVQYLKLMDGTADSTNVAAVSSAGAMSVIETGAHGSGDTKGLSLTTSFVVARCSGANLVGRKVLVLQNDSDVAMLWSFNNTVADDDAMKIPSGQSVEISAGEALNVYVKAASGSGKLCRVGEMG